MSAGSVDDWNWRGKKEEDDVGRAEVSIRRAFSPLPPPRQPAAMDAQKQLQALSDEFQQLQTGMLLYLKAHCYLR